MYPRTVLAKKKYPNSNTIRALGNVHRVSTSVVKTDLRLQHGWKLGFTWMGAQVITEGATFFSEQFFLKKEMTSAQFDTNMFGCAGLRWLNVPRL